MPSAPWCAPSTAPHQRPGCVNPFVRAPRTGEPIGKVSGLTSSRKRHRKAPPAKVTPEKDEELVADDDDPWPSLEEMYVMLIDRVVEQVMIRTLDFYMRATIEDVISIR